MLERERLRLISALLAWSVYVSLVYSCDWHTAQPPDRSSPVAQSSPESSPSAGAWSLNSPSAIGQSSSVHHPPHDAPTPTDNPSYVYGTLFVVGVDHLTPDKNQLPGRMKVVVSNSVFAHNYCRFVLS